MTVVNRLLPMLALLGALAVLGLALAWLVKADATEPLVYAAILATLLLARVPWIARRIDRRRAVAQRGA